MEHNEESKSAPSLSRRAFVKLGATSAAIGTVAAASLPSKVMADVSQGSATPQVQKLNAINMEINGDYRRFNQKDTAFCQAFDGTFPAGGESLSHLGDFNDEKGYRQVDKALTNAGWYLNDTIAGMSQFGVPDSTAYKLDNKPRDTQFQFKSPIEAAMYIKKAARFLGADLVGITSYDERWTYSAFYNPLTKQEIPADLPFTPKSVIVMAFEEDYAAMSAAPTGVSGGAVGMGYSRMAVTASSLRFLSMISVIRPSPVVMT